MSRTILMRIRLVVLLARILQSPSPMVNDNLRFSSANEPRISPNTTGGRGNFNLSKAMPTAPKINMR